MHNHHHNHPDQQDLAYFREAMRGVKKLTQDKVFLKKNVHICDIRPKLQENIEYYPELSASAFSENDLLFFAKTGLQQKIQKKLRQGKIRSSDTLDLHGMITKTAYQQILSFLQRAIHLDYRCVTMIHGKGKVLKNHLTLWLQQIPDVLAFCSALPQEGGAGAVYVLLRLR